MKRVEAGNKFMKRSKSRRNDEDDLRTEKSMASNVNTIQFSDDEYYDDLKKLADEHQKTKTFKMKNNNQILLPIQNKQFSLPDTNRQIQNRTNNVNIYNSQNENLNNQEKYFDGESILKSKDHRKMKISQNNRNNNLSTMNASMISQKTNYTEKSLRALGYVTQDYKSFPMPNTKIPSSFGNHVRYDTRGNNNYTPAKSRLGYAPDFYDNVYDSLFN